MADTRCTVCNHPSRSAIEQALVAGRSNAAIAVEFGSLSKDAVRRHRDRHLAPAMKGAMASREGRAGRTAVDRMEDLYARAEALLTAAEQGGKAGLALGALKELRSIVELLARLTGELDERPQVTVNLAASPEWLQVQAVILQALTAHPEARQAVAGALMAADVVAGEVVE
jgi:hypothetical protein